MGFFVGQVMKATGGKANAQVVQGSCGPRSS
jgi:Asp-tRNA(Asn)/Glu-tRNA(Gln) amidotransferase B subunit